jgi:hypothetical protein
MLLSRHCFRQSIVCVILCKELLSLQIAPLYIIPVNDRDVSSSRPHEAFCAGRSQCTGADEKHMAASQLLLTLFSYWLISGLP